MKVAGITQVRNEIEVIDFTIWHHLKQGLDYIIIEDNGSTDGTLEYLTQLAEKDSRVLVFSNTGPFRQELAFSFLAQHAHSLGCDWVVPFDGDEMWFSPNGLKNDLENCLSDAIRIDYIQNFVQDFNHDPNNEKIYSTARWRIPDNFVHAAQWEIEQKIKSSVEILWGSKIIVRTSPNLQIACGAHSYTNQGQTVISNPDFKIYQVPFRSLDHMIRKSENGMRVKEAGYPYGLGWEAQIWAERYLVGTVFEEWKTNSAHDGKIIRYDGSSFDLQEDDTVCRMYEEFLNDK